ncbi:hypothetical protein [Caballeronia humi]|nr:hypothetical protein [Caballeronia humi]
MGLHARPAAAFAAEAGRCTSRSSACCPAVTVRMLFRSTQIHYSKHA